VTTFCQTPAATLPSTTSTSSGLTWRLSEGYRQTPHQVASWLHRRLPVITRSGGDPVMTLEEITADLAAIGFPRQQRAPLSPVPETQA
jgi:hypothetical protein